MARQLERAMIMFQSCSTSLHDIPNRLQSLLQTNSPLKVADTTAAFLIGARTLTATV